MGTQSEGRRKGLCKQSVLEKYVSTQDPGHGSAEGDVGRKGLRNDGCWSCARPSGERECAMFRNILDERRVVGRRQPRSRPRSE